jgi:hypothetical protein
MPMHAFGLDGLLDDLRSRYGEADAVVVQIRAALDLQRQDAQLHPLVERRATNSPAKSHSRAGWHEKFKSSHTALSNFVH